MVSKYIFEMLCLFKEYRFKAVPRKDLVMLTVIVGKRGMTDKQIEENYYKFYFITEPNYWQMIKTILKNPV